VTAWDVLVALARRWYFTFAGIAATVVGLMLVAPYPGVYWSQANVVFLAPQSIQRPNSLEFTSSGLISTAGYVEQIINAGVKRPETASPVTLIGQGVRNGHSIVLPNSGGQWAQNFDKAILNVQVTGPNAHIVESRLENLIERIRMTTQEIQDRDAVIPESRISTYVSPANPHVSYATGGRPSALAGAFVLGVGLTVFSVVGLDRIFARRQRPRPNTASSKRIPVSV